MKPFFLFLFTATLCLAASCQQEVLISAGGPGRGPTEVEIEISTLSNAGGTRTPADGATGLKIEKGDAQESVVNTLDLLVFAENGGFLYHKEAAKIPKSQTSESDLYRASLQPVTGKLDVQFFANCREILETWETTGPSKVGQNWATVYGQLKDLDPKRLVNSETFEYLPMHGSLYGQSIETDKAPTRWGKVDLLRSVASVDLYVEKNVNTSRFILREMFAWYAANTGLLPGIVDEDNGYVLNGINAVRYELPSGMTSSLKALTDTPGDTVLHAKKVEDLITQEATYRAINYQMYLFENYYANTSDPTKRPTRIIVGGRYKLKDAVPATATTEEIPAEWVDAYYPIDIVEDNGPYRPLIRNWKYEFLVNSISGRGYDNLEDAADGPTIDLTLNVIYWNKNDVKIGVKGHYYVTMDQKEVRLWRDAGNFKEVDLLYEIRDDYTDAGFELLGFKNALNGEMRPLEEPGVTGIENDYFRVVMVKTPGVTAGTGTVLFTVTAKTAYNSQNNPLHYTDAVTVKFRDLTFDIDISQVDGSEEDWGDGGFIDKNA